LSGVLDVAPRCAVASDVGFRAILEGHRRCGLELIARAFVLASFDRVSSFVQELAALKGLIASFGQSERIQTTEAHLPSLGAVQHVTEQPGLCAGLCDLKIKPTTICVAAAGFNRRDSSRREAMQCSLRHVWHPQNNPQIQSEL